MDFRKGPKSPGRTRFFTVCAILALALAFLFYIAVSGGSAEVERETFAMGTLVKVSVYGRGEASLTSAAEAALAEISRLEELFSVNIAGSDISRINADPAKPGGHEVSAETYELLRLALSEAEATGGAFDPTIGALVSFWGIGTEKARIPSAADNDDIADMQSVVGWSKVSLREASAEGGEERTVYFVSAGAGQALDLGGVAKGYAADRVAAILRARGVKSALVDIGGNLVAIGRSPKRREWRLGFQDPFRPRGNYFASVSVSDATIVTSGAYERFVRKNGVLYHHILDPETGYPAMSDLESVSIVMEHTGSRHNSARSDALSTALFVMGFERAVKFLEGHGEVQAVLVSRREDGPAVYVTDGLKQRVAVQEDVFPKAKEVGR